jgi:hypothetical protein
MLVRDLKKKLILYLDKTRELLKKFLLMTAIMLKGGCQSFAINCQPFTFFISFSQLTIPVIKKLN